MKRFITLVCLFLTLTFSANAEWALPIVDEEFSIRNGISFGMTKEEVLAVEKANGNNPFSETRDFFKDISFLGESVDLEYFFTKSNKLSSFAYSCMPYYDGLKVSNLDFATIYEALNEKYGEPMLTTEFSLYSTAVWKSNPFNLFTHSSKWSADTLSGGVASSSEDGKIWISNYAVWLVKHKDCAIVIELAEATSTGRSKFWGLGYAAITNEQMETWFNFREAENQAATNSYANDI